MATTWIKALHGGGSIAAALDLRIDYAMNDEKTNDGDLITAFKCDPKTAQSEFLLSKKIYERNTGRNQGKRDVIAYHIRMSFKPGEVTPQHVLAIGKELALRWTKGKHQFIVAAHTNTNNPHCHIVYNSTNLDCKGKYQDFKHSAIALRKLSDQICLEHGLSVIEKPGLSKGFNRTEYVGKGKPPSARDILRGIIDEKIIAGMSYIRFISEMKIAGCEVKQGKHLSFKIPNGKKFIRLDSLGEDYSETAIAERLSGKRIVAHKPRVIQTKNENKPNLLIDIQAKIAEGKGEGYAHWAKVFNLKETAKTLIFLQDNGVTTYDELVRRKSEAADDYNKSQKRRKEIDARLADITELQKQIGTYGKTRAVYQEYKAIQNPKKRDAFYNANRANITLCEAAKRYFDSLRLPKIPKIDELKQEYAALLIEKRKLGDIKEKKETMLDWANAKYNVERLFGYDQTAPKKSRDRDER